MFRKIHHFLSHYHFLQSIFNCLTAYSFIRSNKSTSSINCKSYITKIRIVYASTYSKINLNTYDNRREETVVAPVSLSENGCCQFIQYFFIYFKRWYRTRRERLPYQHMHHYIFSKKLTILKLHDDVLQIVCNNHYLLIF